MLIGDGSLGAPEHAPFGAIAVAAAADELPLVWSTSSPPAARLVLPLGGSLVRVTLPDGRMRIEPLAAVRFVRLVTDLSS